MGLSVLSKSIVRNILFCTAAIGFGCLFAAVVMAQHAGVRIAPPVRVAPARPYIPRTAPMAVSRPRLYAGPHLMGVNNGAFGFRRHPIYVFRRPVFFGAAFFRFDEGLWFQSYAWLTCTTYWRSGLGCNGLPLDENGFENYVTLPAYEPPLYWYGAQMRDLVQLYLKNGDRYSVTDYWFVDGKLHFVPAEEDTEQVIDFDELDVQKTIEVNTRRGFRLVMRDEPWEQYLHDHPDLTPPPLQPPQK
jgi:hypothetical protein